MDKIDSGSGVLWVYLSGDEGRATRQLQDIAARYSEESDVDLAWFTWNGIEGGSWDSNCLDPMKALEDCRDKIPGDGLILLKDFATFLNGSGIKGVLLRRALIELCIANAVSNNQGGGRTRPIVILANTPIPHEDISEYCDVVDFDLPKYAEMEKDAVDFIVRSIARGTGANEAAAIAAVNPALKEKVVRGLLGCTSEEAQRMFAYAAAVSRGVNDQVLDVLAKEKAKVIRKVEGLQFIPYEKIPDQDNIGGFGAFLPWLHKRARAYTRHAKEIGLELPRGAVLIGPPGTGKTMVAKAAAKMLGLDLIVMDIGSMFDKYVGGSEGKIRGALQMVSAMPNALLMIDEIDKAFAGASEGSAGDSGVSARVLGYFLNWLSERDMSPDNDNRVFVMVTMNRTAGVPPELLRPGRFDRVWSTDLPDADERKQILEIHLKMRGVPPSMYKAAIKRVVSATDTYTGAELEEVVVTARNNAYDARMTEWEKASKGPKPTAVESRPTIEELLRATKEMTPVAKLDSKAVDAIRKFCQDNTYPVNGERVQNTARTRASRKVTTTRGAGTPSDN